MNLIEESFREKQEKPKRTRKILLTLIILFTIAIFIIIGILIANREVPLTSNIDGKTDTEFVSMLRSENDITYVPIKRVSKILGYTPYNGEYGNSLSETTSKCYVQSSNEAVSLSLASKRIYVNSVAGNNKEYQYYIDMENEVKAFDGELYIDLNDMEKVFNTTMVYDETKKIIKITTLPELVKKYSSKVLEYGYSELDDNFINQKAIMDNLLIAKDIEGKYVGILDATTGEVLVDSKYSSIEYMPAIGDCIVGDSNSNYGVVSPKEAKKSKIDVVYQEIDLVDKEAGLYVVKKDGKYGMLDLKGVSKLPIDYDAIGIENITLFKENNIKNKYLLVDNLIPIKKGKLWGMVNKKGETVVNLEFDSFGYIASNNKNATNLLVIPEYDVIVACKNKKYSLINKSGVLIINPVVDDIYMQREGDVYKYYMNYNDQTKEAKDILNQLGVSSNGEPRNNTISEAEQQRQQQAEQQQRELEEQQRQQQEQQQRELEEQQRQQQEQQQRELEEQQRQQQEQQQNQDNGQENEQQMSQEEERLRLEQEQQMQMMQQQEQQQEQQ